MSQFIPRSGSDDELRDLLQVQKILREMKALVHAADKKNPIAPSRIGSLASRLRLHLSRLNNATAPLQRARIPTSSPPISSNTSSRPRAEQLRARVDSQALIFQKSLQEKAQYSKLASHQRSQCPLTTASIEQKAQLLPLSEFFQQCPEYASLESVDPHQLILKRLRHEQQLRLNLIEQEQRVRRYKEQLQARIEKRKASLYAIEQVVHNVVNTTQVARRQVEHAVQQCWQHQTQHTGETEDTQGVERGAQASGATITPAATSTSTGTSTTAIPSSSVTGEAPAKRFKLREEEGEVQTRKFQIPENTPEFIPVNVHMSAPPAKLHLLPEPLQLLACGLMSCTSVFFFTLSVEESSHRMTTWGDLALTCHEYMLCVELNNMRLYFQYCMELHSVYLSIAVSTVYAGNNEKSAPQEIIPADGKPGEGKTVAGVKNFNYDSGMSDTTEVNHSVSSEKLPEFVVLPTREISQLSYIFPVPRFPSADFYPFACSMVGQGSTPGVSTSEIAENSEDLVSPSSGTSFSENTSADNIPECPLGIAPAWLQRLSGLNNSGAHCYLVRGHVYDPFYEKSFGTSLFSEKTDSGKGKDSSGSETDAFPVADASSPSPSFSTMLSEMRNSEDIDLSECVSHIYMNMEKTQISLSWADALRRITLVLNASMRVKRIEKQALHALKTGETWESEGSEIPVFFPNTGDILTGITEMCTSILIRPSGTLIESLQKILSSTILPVYVSSSSSLRVTQMNVVEKKMKAFPTSRVCLMDVPLLSILQHQYQITYSTNNDSVRENVNVNVYYPPTYPLLPPLFTLEFLGNSDDSQMLSLSGFDEELNSFFSSQLSTQARCVLISSGAIIPVDYACRYLRLKMDQFFVSSVTGSINM